MAEKEAPPIARRPSFRKTLRDAEATLPPEFLESLEQKRKQLDDSIHKYIAAKEREYKQFEKDLKQQAKNGGDPPALAASHNGHGESNGSLSAATKRRASSESTQEASVGGSPMLRASQTSPAIDALLASSSQQKSHDEALEIDGSDPRKSLAGLKDRRASEEREKEFVGLFTPSYLPAIDRKDEREPERSESAPCIIQTTQSKDTPEAEVLPRPDSETSMLAKAKRPVHLQLTQRTSSSGSSADGGNKRVSAMKSPIQSQNPKPKTKRVSLAVGDSIVAPSDNVPLPASNNRTASHSRQRSPNREREPHALKQTTPLVDTLDFCQLTTTEKVERVMNGVLPVAVIEPPKVETPIPAARAAVPAPRPSQSGPTASPKPQIDPDGDLFDLEDEDDPLPIPPPNDDYEHALEDDDEDDNTSSLAGRVEPPRPDSSSPPEVILSPPGLRPGEKYDYDAEAGLVPSQPTDIPENAEDSRAVHLEFRPGSATASQQPTQPGFRRPSVHADPVFMGSGYATAEAEAANEEVYGSSYSRPSKGSFTSHSLGQSYMARHAEERMKMALERRQQEVK